MQKRLAISGGTAVRRKVKLDSLIKEFTGTIGYFTRDPKVVPKGVYPIPYNVPVVGLKFDNLVVDDADDLAQDRMDYGVLFGLATTMVVVFPEDGGRVKVSHN